MSERVIPQPDRYASCPQGGPILEYYRGVFSWVYVILNPCIKPVRLGFDRFSGESYPTRKEIQKDCESISWSEVLQQAQLKDISAIDVGLRTSIRGIKTEFEDSEAAKRLLGFEAEAHVLIPPEDEHPDLLHDQALNWLKGLGYKWVWVGDELCREHRLHWIDDLLEETKPTIKGRVNVFTPDKELLWTVHWDSQCTFLCGTSDRSAKDSIEGEFEGFSCSERTQVYWGAYPI